MQIHRLIVTGVAALVIMLAGVARVLAPVEAQDGAPLLTHTVQPDETLSRIALIYNVSVEDLARANDLADSRVVAPGLVLVIPRAAASAAPAVARQHTVALGETLSSIARRYGLPVGDLMAANHLVNPNLIRVGQRLIIPAGGQASPSSAAHASSSDPVVQAPDLGIVGPDGRKLSASNSPPPILTNPRDDLQPDLGILGVEPGEPAPAVAAAIDLPQEPFAEPVLSAADAAAELPAPVEQGVVEADTPDPREVTDPLAIAPDLGILSAPEPEPAVAAEEDPPVPAASDAAEADALPGQAAGSEPEAAGDPVALAGDPAADDAEAVSPAPEVAIDALAAVRDDAKANAERDEAVNSMPEQAERDEAERDEAERDLPADQSAAPDPREVTDPSVIAPDLGILAPEAAPWLINGSIISTGGPVVRATYELGQELGNNPHAFSKIGDCNSEPPFFLVKFDEGTYDLGPYAYLQPAIDQFAGSFARKSATVWTGNHVWAVFDPTWANPAICLAGETPIECEFRTNRPSIVLIRMGTNEAYSQEMFETYLRQIIEFSLERGTIPVLGTKADRLEGSDVINELIRSLADEYKIPLWDFSRAADNIPGRGLRADGFHMTFGSLYYNDPAALQSGHAVQNLTALMALDSVWRSATD